MTYILMGVAGSGKTTIGKLLSKQLDYPFYDGDDFHPRANILKMSRNLALDDRDRLPWLLRLKELIDNNPKIIVACSALKKSYRTILQGENKQVIWIYLKGEYSEISRRIENRQGHFMKREMLRSQFNTLEEPSNAITISISQDTTAIVKQILEQIE
ncbi:MAG: gluconokinase [Prochloraceae cyanobacterium]|nr:gluconokinase [Prochloraceae cyanobacterium]